MKIDIVPALELPQDYLALWSDLQRTEPTLANPFFRPEFALAVAAERGEVEVAVWRNEAEPVGFLPFERCNGRVGWPVGSRISQFQGAIVRSGVDWSPRQVVRATGLRGFRFDHLPTSHAAFAPYQYVASASPYLDLSQGFEHYRKSRGKSAAVFISHILQKDRKAGRDLGDVRLVSSPESHGALQRLIDWKIEQCVRTRIPCVLKLDWVLRLHERLLTYRTDDFAGTLFCLYMGDRLAAGFYCLRSRNVLQGVVLGYDRELGPYAPGLVLLMRVAQMAGSLGITRIDLGSGGDQYKDKLASNCDYVAEGVVPSRAVLAPLYRRLIRTKDRLRSTRLRGPVRAMRAWMLATRIRMGYTD